MIRAESSLVQRSRFATTVTVTLTISPSDLARIQRAKRKPEPLTREELSQLCQGLAVDGLAKVVAYGGLGQEADRIMASRPSEPAPVAPNVTAQDMRLAFGRTRAERESALDQIHRRP